MGRFGLAGAISGVVLGIVLMTQSQINLYPFNGFVERLTFRLCPLYVLGFVLKSWVELIAAVLISNAFLYGVLFAVVGAVIGACTRDPNQSRVSST
jgi:hypothetical protein